MILSSSETFYSLIVFLAFGMLAGFLFFLVFDIQKISKNNFSIAFVCDFFAVIFAGLVFHVAIFNFENGLISVFLLLPFLIGFAFFAVFVRKSFVSCCLNVYNKLKSRKKQGGRKDE